MKSYEDIGLTNRLRSKNSVTNRESNYTTALANNLAVEPTPYLHRTSVLNRGGTVQTNLGAIVDLKDLTGGTSVFTYDPTTGAITMNGPLVLNGTTNIPNQGTVGTLNVSGAGTAANWRVTGTTVLSGSVTFGSAIQLGGTIDMNQKAIINCGYIIGDNGGVAFDQAGEFKLIIIWTLMVLVT